jgi:hypothetical protein
MARQTRTSTESTRCVVEMISADERLVLIHRLMEQCRAGIWDLIDRVDRLELVAEERTKKRVRH